MTKTRTVWVRVLVAVSVSRLLMVGAIVALWIAAPPAHLVCKTDYNRFITRDCTASENFDFAFHNTLTRWDTQAYLRIADHGYRPEPEAQDKERFAPILAERGYSAQLNADDAFLPAYPALTAVTGRITGDLLLGGLLVSLMAEIVALFYIHRLVDVERNGKAAHFAIWAVALSWCGVFLGVVYTEALFIAAAAAALHYMRDGQFVKASLATCVACSTRITGVAVIAALGIEYLRQKPLRLRRDLAAVLFLPPLPLVAFCVYMKFHTGDFFALLHANDVFFTHTAASPVTGFWATFNTAKAFPPGSDFQRAFIAEVGFGVAGMLACAGAWLMPRFPKSFAAYCSVVVLTAVSISFWRSVPRYEMALFPMVIILADLTNRVKVLRPVFVAFSSIAFTYGTWVFASGRWLS